MLPSVKLVAIDDTPASLELVSEALQQEGLTIFTATDPEEGLDLMEQALVQMESSPSDLELLHNIFRVAHTLKGNATSLGLSELAGFAHVV